MTRIHELIVYRNFENGQILEDMAWIFDHAGSEYYNEEDLRGLYYECIHGLVDLAGTYGFEGNLWHTYLTYLLVNNENAFSTASEIRGEISGSINELAYHDFEIFKELYDFDFVAVEKALETSCYAMIADYKGSDDQGKMFNKRIRDRICELSRRLGSTESIDEFKKDMSEFYKDFGVGKLGLHKAFRVAHDEDGVHIVPITKIAHVHLSDLVGYEAAKKKLIDNTEAFVEGRPANNCLLFGDAGTGKSTSIKGILNEYYDQRFTNHRGLQASVPGSERGHRSDQKQELPLHHLHGRSFF